MLSSSRTSVPEFVLVFAAEKVEGDETDDPHHQVGDDQAGDGSQQFAGQNLRAADRFAQQEIGGQFALFNRDQAKTVVAGLNGQAELDEQEEETVKTQHSGQVHIVHTEGGQQFRWKLGQQFVHQRSLVGKYRKQREEENDEEYQSQRPDDHRFQAGVKFVSEDVCVHGLLPIRSSA